GGVGFSRGGGGASPSGPTGVGDGAGFPGVVEAGLGVGVGAAPCTLRGLFWPAAPGELKTIAENTSTTTAIAADHRNNVSAFGSGVFINSFLNHTNEMNPSTPIN